MPDNNIPSVAPTAEIEVATEPNVLANLEKASIDMQIATAHQFPRSLQRFRENAGALVTLDEETAASCLYRRPVGKDKRGNDTYAEGMSIRMAEIVASCYGNLRVGTRIIESTPRYIVAQGIAHDLETNFLSTAECKEATVDKYGKPYTERMRVVIEKAAMAKAWRDAVFKVVPRSAAKFLETAAKNLLFGNATSISKWRDSIKQWVKTLGIEEKRVWKALGVEGPEDMKRPEFEQVLGLKNALQSGDITLDEAFPPIVNEESGGRYMAPQKKLPEKAAPATKEPEPASEPTPEPNVAQNAPETPSRGSSKTGTISEAQARRLRAISMEQHLDKDEVSFILYSECGVQTAEEVTRADYDHVIEVIQSSVHGEVLPPEEGDLI